MKGGGGGGGEGRLIEREGFVRKRGPSCVTRHWGRWWGGEGGGGGVGSCVVVGAYTAQSWERERKAGKEREEGGREERERGQAEMPCCDDDVEGAVCVEGGRGRRKGRYTRGRGSDWEREEAGVGEDWVAVAAEGAKEGGGEGRAEGIERIMREEH